MYRVIKSKRMDLKRQNINFLCCFRPSGYFFWAFQTMGIYGSYRKTLMGVGKIEKIDFSLNKSPWSEMGIRRIRTCTITRSTRKNPHRGTTRTFFKKFGQPLPRTCTIFDHRRAIAIVCAGKKCAGCAMVRIIPCGSPS